MIKSLFYIDPFSLLVIGSGGKLLRIFCPFLVKSNISFENFKEGQIFHVDMVKSELETELTFIIKGKPYKHTHFEILI